MAGQASKSAGGGGKDRRKRKVWYEIYWPDASQSHANKIKSGKIHSRRVANPREGRKLFKLLLHWQSVYEETGLEHPILQGYGAYVVAQKRAPKEVIHG